MSKILHLTAAAALAGFGLMGCGGESSDSESDDVVVTACNAAAAGGKPSASGTISNATSKDSGYTFLVKFLDPSGNEVSQGTDAVAKVDAGGTATWDLDGITSANGPVTCKVANVTRTAVP